MKHTLILCLDDVKCLCNNEFYEYKIQYIEGYRHKILDLTKQTSLSTCRNEYYEIIFVDFV